MNGDDLDQVLIAFQAELLVVRMLFRGMDLITEPTQQGVGSMRTATMAGLSLKQLGKVEEVGQDPLSAGRGMETADSLLLFK
jgi:hypothetical protein